ncbi:GNAT family N-acetyltransferase [Aeromicrobium massiliense]|uniref:GNAT family N-acetyltransferase n=1 Tax=Aeromicrobium massiliense TaxID=1464554 RepID=UPI000310DEF4|nr:GNAT family N-acetyltransferase [Aeromicrobium massiliense]
MIIETERLVLRPYTDADAERVLDIHSRLEVIRWLDDPPWTPMADLDEARAWIANWERIHEKDERDVGLAIEVRETGVVAGTIMCVPLPKSQNGEKQIGWHLHPDSVGHGYVTEAASALLDHVLPLVGNLWCDMFADNAPSAAVARRLGLRELGVRPDPWYGGESLMFHVTRDEWQARRPA